jgi:hypothetical protein
MQIMARSTAGATPGWVGSDIAMGLEQGPSSAREGPALLQLPESVTFGAICWSYPNEPCITWVCPGYTKVR